VVKVLVIQGQAVGRGRPLAVVRAAETVQYGAALARSQAELPVAAAQAARWGNWRARASSPRPRGRGPRSPAAAGDHCRKPPPAGAGRCRRDGTITLRAPISGASQRDGRYGRGGGQWRAPSSSRTPPLCA
jgi:cobalt-zinc-cadmium efflux system membrane fusion protein